MIVNDAADSLAEHFHLGTGLFLFVCFVFFSEHANQLKGGECTFHMPILFCKTAPTGYVVTILTILCTLGCSQGLGEVSGGATLGRFQFTLCMFGFFFLLFCNKKKKSFVFRLTPEEHNTHFFTARACNSMSANTGASSDVVSMEQ